MNKYVKRGLAVLFCLVMLSGFVWLAYIAWKFVAAIALLSFGVIGGSAGVVWVFNVYEEWRRDRKGI